MQCDQCGREIRSGEDSIPTTVERPNDQVTGAYPIRSTRTSSIMLCAECAAYRNGTLRWFLWAVLLVIVGMIASGLLMRLFLP